MEIVMPKYIHPHERQRRVQRPVVSRLVGIHSKVVGLRLKYWDVLEKSDQALLERIEGELMGLVEKYEK
jgi:hypothetical protein